MAAPNRPNMWDILSVVSGLGENENSIDDSTDDSSDSAQILMSSTRKKMY